MQQPRLFAATHSKFDQKAYTLRTEFVSFLFWRIIIVTNVCMGMVLLSYATSSMCLRKQIEIQYNHFIKFVDDEEMIQSHQKETDHA